MATFNNTYQSWSPAYNATVTNPNWILTRSSTGVALTHTGTTSNALDGWVIIPVPVLNNTVNLGRGPTPTAFSLRLALQNSATLNSFDLWDGEKPLFSAALPPGPGGPRDGPSDGSAQTGEAGLLPGQVGEMKLGASVAAHITFKETPNLDGKSEVRLIGAGVSFALVDPSVPETQPTDSAKALGVSGLATVTVK
ncbi:hypothetical protein ACEPPN_012159 [Leptodophora sp. 'Broadleaf-Isolate-01']